MPWLQMPSCIACGECPEITAESLPLYSYAAFTGAPSNDAGPTPLELLIPVQRVRAAEVIMLPAGTSLLRNIVLLTFVRHHVLYHQITSGL